METRMQQPPRDPFPDVIGTGGEHEIAIGVPGSDYQRTFGEVHRARMEAIRDAMETRQMVDVERAALIQAGLMGEGSIPLGSITLPVGK
jgi:hypothetical protein